MITSAQQNTFTYTKKLLIMNKKIKIALISLGSLFAIFAIITVVHIGIMVSNKPASSFYQMARADFNPSTPAEKINELKTNLATQEGFIRSHYNADAGTFVYTFDTRYTNSTELYNNSIKNTVADSKQHILTEAMKLEGCPVGADNKIYSSLTSAVTAFIY